MSNDSHSAKIGVQVKFTGTEPSLNPVSDVPFRILVLGDFSGRTNRGLDRRGDSSASWRPVLVDRDNLDEIIAKLNVEVHLPLNLAAPKVRITFRELDDFHPDRLFERLGVFQTLHKTRHRLKNPETFAEAAAEVQLWPQTKQVRNIESQSDIDPDKSLPNSQGDLPSDADIFDQMLEQTARQDQSLEQRIAAGDVDWSQYIRELVEPYSVAKADPRQSELVASVDEVTNQVMRSVLHHPDFQAIESAWRAVDFLTRRLETDGRLRVYLLDISKQELADEFNSSNDLRSTGLYKSLVDQSVGTTGAEPWAVFLGNYIFNSKQDDIELIGRMAKVADAAGAPFLAAASPQVIGCESLDKTPDPDDWGSMNQEAEASWQSLRQIPESPYVGLLLPRFLLRMPYGKQTDPTDQFAFEEMGEGTHHQHYLWGNPAFASVLLLGQAFSRYGWALLTGLETSIEGLAAHVFQEDGESQLKPCAEILLTDRAVEMILSRGLMPLVSVKDRDTVRVPAFRSCSKSEPALAGRWW